MIAALILAGGASQRMGRTKALLPFPDIPLVTAQWRALRAAGVDPVRIVVGAGSDAVMRGSGLPRENFVVNRRPRGTQFSSIQIGLRALLMDDTWPAAAVQPVDALPPHPSVVLALAGRLADANVLAVLPAHRGRGGHPVLLARALCDEIVRMDPRRDRLDVVLHRLEAVAACERVEVFTDEVLANLNVPRAYMRALRVQRLVPERRRCSGGLRSRP